ncbi:hypothetical protein [Petrachloros mirabilis]
MVETVRKYILHNFLFTDDEGALSNKESLIQKGVIDSTGALEVINFLEDTFCIRVEDAEMVPENLDSVDRIVQYVWRKQAVRN